MSLFTARRTSGPGALNTRETIEFGYALSEEEQAWVRDVIIAVLGGTLGEDAGAEKG